MIKFFQSQSIAELLSIENKRAPYGKYTSGFDFELFCRHRHVILQRLTKIVSEFDDQSQSYDVMWIFKTLLIFRRGGKRLYFCTTILLRTMCTKFYHNRSSFVDCISKHILVCFSVHSIYTLCLKKVPTLKLSVTLSNLNRFSKFLNNASTLACETPNSCFWWKF